MRSHTYFIADLHLGARYIADPRAHERCISDWLLSIASEARTLYMLGDVLDYWYEYREVVPRGFVRFFGALATLADQGVEIVWLKGNHDIWLFDYLSGEIGLQVADGIIDTVIDGRRFVMEHGDGVGRQSRTFRFLRSMFRNRTCQRLYSAIHPRWTVAFAHRWSSHSRLTGREDTSTTLSDTDPLVVFAREYMRDNGPVDYFVFGHRHILVDRTIDGDTRLIVLGDGFRRFTYGDFDGRHFSLKSMNK